MEKNSWNRYVVNKLRHSVTLALYGTSTRRGRTTHLSDEGRDPDEHEYVTAMNAAEDVERQVESASTQLVTEDHHDERVEHERVVNGRHTAHVNRPARTRADHPLSFNTPYTHGRPLSTYRVDCNA